METFGSYLKNQREKKGIRLEEIASITKIHIHSLELLENGRWDKLPPEPFIRGFIIAYAKYVGLEPKDAIALYIKETRPSSPEAAADSKSGSEATPTNLTSSQDSKVGTQTASELMEKGRAISFKKIGIGAGVLAAIVILFSVMRIGKHSSEGEAPAPPLVAVAPAVETAAPTQATATETAPATSPTPTVAPVAETKTAPEVPVAAVKPAPVVATTAPAATTTPDPREVASTPPTTSSATSTATAIADEAAHQHEVVIEGKERTWIKVVVDEDAPIEYFLPEGQKATYKAKSKIKVVLGNSTGTKVTHNGETSPGVKFQGTIRSYIFPSDSRFPQDAPSKRAPSSNVVDTDTN